MTRLPFLASTMASLSSATLGGPVDNPPVTQRDPYQEESVAVALAVSRPVRLYTKENAPETPELEDLPLTESVSQYGITWTFAKPARVGRFLGGDWYVVGPVTINAVDPQTLYGREIPRRSDGSPRH